MSFLDRLLGRRGEPRDEGIYFYLRCTHCERVLHTRLDPKQQLSPRDGGGYEIRKELMDDRCFRRLLLAATFDSSYQLIEAKVEGGALIDRATWEAERGLPRRPPSPAE